MEATVPVPDSNTLHNSHGKTTCDARNDIRNRITPELVFAFVEPLCGGVDDVIDKFKTLLESHKFGYKVNNINISSIIKNFNIPDVTDDQIDDSLKKLPNLSEEAKRINKLQIKGNLIRKQYGTDILIKYAIKEISRLRHKDGMSDKNKPKPMRVVHFVKSLKNYDELLLLKEVYGNILFLIGVSNSDNKRLTLFKNKALFITPEEARQEYDILSSIDQDEGIDYGQNVRSVFYKADIFLSSSSNMAHEIERFLNLLFGLQIYSPTIDGVMMHEAYSASLRSCCLSRQVGAAIATNSGELISTGWNDVPSFNGGLIFDYEDKYCSLCKNITFCNSNQYLNKLFKNILSAIGLRDEIVADKLKEEYEHNPKKKNFKRF